jgi:hypothetical protein
VAIETVRRFLLVSEGAEVTPAAPQRVVRVTEAVVAKSGDFRFAGEWRGLQILPKAGTPVAMDGEKVWRTPYDDCVLVMPSLVHLKPGRTMVRLGRYD